MTNLEKYKDKIIEELSEKPFCFITLNLRTGKNNRFDDCGYNRNCLDCQMESVKWLAQEYTESKKEFTQDELAIMRNIDKKWKWIAIDKNNILCVYTKKPYKASKYWTINDGYFEKIKIFNCFKQIQWEDSKPVFIDDYVKR